MSARDFNKDMGAYLEKKSTRSAKAKRQQKKESKIQEFFTRVKTFLFEPDVDLSKINSGVTVIKKTDSPWKKLFAKKPKKEVHESPDIDPKKIEETIRKNSH